jgi:hypothetical protein
MTTLDRANKRVKVEVMPATELRSEPKFAIGDKVYKFYQSEVPPTVRTTLFTITDRARGADGWSFRIANDAFLGEGCVLWVPESHPYTVKYSLRDKFRFDVKGSSRTTQATGSVTGWSLVDGKVVYDIDFYDKVECRDRVPLSLWLYGVEAYAKSSKGWMELSRYNAKPLMEPQNRGDAVVVTQYEGVTVQMPADILDCVPKING